MMYFNMLWSYFAMLLQENTWSDKLNFSKTGIDLAKPTHKSLSTKMHFSTLLLNTLSVWNEDSRVFNSSKNIVLGFGFKKLIFIKN